MVLSYNNGPIHTPAISIVQAENKTLPSVLIANDHVTDINTFELIIM